ncbi:C-GCAxxG-C-C family (seleno)protein [Melioribacteraceae bacterium 4301-Me]|uniref:C-GCAxxG-C-C family (seleno)protein n=1 Tax=Pyranulibacter aquaticus TaxID=3163344 RepID=UPI003595C288
MPREITRKEFLTSTSKYAVGAVAGVVGLNALAGGKILANTKTTWPLPYTQLDPEVVRLKAHHLYWNDKDCASGVFGAFTEALSELLPDPWANIPMEVMLFGRGGGNGWGTLCGAVNGAAAIISLVTSKADSGALINEVWGYYTSSNFPSDAANQAALDGKYEDKKYNDALPQSVSGSVLCHASVTQWCITANKKVSDVERKERCARLAGDVAAKTAEVLNAFFAHTFQSTFVTDPAVAQCMTCHGPSGFNNVMSQMNCKQCHGDPHNVNSVVMSDKNVPNDFQLSQNYPNPFNPSTKLQVAVARAEKVSLIIYDIMGREVKRLIDYEVMQPGKYTVDWDGTDGLGNRVASGIYFARMTAGEFQQTKKMNLVK